MGAEIISVGSELLQGEVLNTNFTYLAPKLLEHGVGVDYQVTVGDEEERLKEVIKIALSRSRIIILTGGLGSTRDDITRFSLSQATGRRLILNKKVLKELKARYSRLGRRFLPIHENMALFPQGSIPIPNYVGMAPGIYLEHEGRLIIVLPGIPEEMKDVWSRVEEKILPEKNAVIKRRIIKTVGLPECIVNERIKEIMEKDNPQVGLRVTPEGVNISIMVKAGSEIMAEEILEKTEEEVNSRLGDHVYAVDENTMEKVVGMLLTVNKLTLSVAESCTGGLISHRITNVPGSSNYFLMSVVTYSNESKIKELGVEEKLIKEQGAVSGEVCEAMARGIRKKADSDIGIAVTGIAGPGGGSVEKPVGLVFVGIATKDKTKVEKHQFSGSRQTIKFRASQVALDLVRRYILGLL